MNWRLLMRGKPFFETGSTAIPPTSGLGLMRVSVPSRTTTFDARINPAPWLLTFISTS
jgi:hypothetical protein